MRVLFLGGTGNIGGAVSRHARDAGVEVVHLNRGNRPPIPGVASLRGDLSRPETVRAAIQGERFDAVVNWIAFTEADVERDFELFAGRTDQYVFISSASAYEKPPRTPFITESTPLRNPYWEYSRNKIAAENRLMALYRDHDFPVTIVRPSLTYDNVIPVALGGWNCFTVIDRMRRGRPMVVHGDGTSLWTITHADDFAKGFVPLLGRPDVLGESFHITSDEVLTWNQIYTYVAEAAGAEPNLVHIPTDFIVKVAPETLGGLWGDKAHSAIFDNAKIKRYVPSYRAEIPFREGIRRTVAWFEADPARMTLQDGNNVLLDRILDAYTGATR